MTADAPLFPALTARDIDLLIAAALNDAYSCDEYDPTRAAMLTDVARRLERHKFACRRIPYRPAPVSVVVESENVAALVREWDGPTPGAPA